MTLLNLDIAFKQGGINYQFKETLNGKKIAITGPSGSGKSTLFKLIAGFKTPDQGIIKFQDKVLFEKKKRVCLKPQKRNIGYVLQDSSLFPHLNVKKNIEYGWKRKKWQRSEDHEVAHHDIIELFGLESLLNRYPRNLSGGEEQRVAIARALFSNPSLFLFDEPLTALDLKKKQAILELIEQIPEKWNIPFLYITHSWQELLKIADTVVFIENGQIKECVDVDKVSQSSSWIKLFGEDKKGLFLMHDDIGAIATQESSNLQKIFVPFDKIILFTEKPKGSESFLLKIFINNVNIDKNKSLLYLSFFIKNSQIKKNYLIELKYSAVSHLSLAIGSEVFLQFKDYEVLSSTTHTKC